jgi:hypothetical protein
MYKRSPSYTLGWINAYIPPPISLFIFCDKSISASSILLTFFGLVTFAVVLDICSNSTTVKGDLS